MAKGTRKRPVPTPETGLLCGARFGCRLNNLPRPMIQISVIRAGKEESAVDTLP